MRCPHCGHEFMSEADKMLASLCERFTLTARQRDVLECFLRLRMLNGGVAPTLEEMAQDLGLRRESVHEHVAKLRTMGLLSRTRKRRSIKLTA